MGAAIPLGRNEPFVIEEAMLVLEVSEPTVLGMSLGMLSISSAGVRDGSDTEVSRRDLELAGSSCRALGV